MKSSNNQSNGVDMGIQPTKIELYGVPQGNEFVYGKEIIRQTGAFEFNVVGRFKSHKEANEVYDDWMTEYSERDFADGEKIWSYSKPITGIDENGQPIFTDTWTNYK